MADENKPKGPPPPPPTRKAPPTQAGPQFRVPERNLVEPTLPAPPSGNRIEPPSTPEPPRPQNRFASMVIGEIPGQSLPDTGATRRREIIDLFLITVRASDMAKATNPANVHFALDQNFDKVVKGDVFDCEALYPVLSQMKGVTKDMAAGVLLAFKNREDRLRLNVKLPRDVDALPLGAKLRLVSAVLEPERADDAQHVASLVMRKAEAAADRGELAIRASGDASPAHVIAADIASRRRRNRWAIARRAAVIVLGAAAITVNVVFYLWDDITVFNAQDVAHIMKLKDAKMKGGEHLQAGVVPPLPYFELMPRKMETLCATVHKRGIGAVDLFEGEPSTRTAIANCFFTPGIDVPRIWVSPGLDRMPLDEIKKLPANDPLRERLLPKEKPKPVGIFPEATPPPPPPPPPPVGSPPKTPLGR